MQRSNKDCYSMTSSARERRRGDAEVLITNSSTSIVERPSPPLLDQLGREDVRTRRRLFDPDFFS
jgi:hypothetical protein